VLTLTQDVEYHAQLDIEDLRGPRNDTGIELGLQAGRQILDNGSPSQDGAISGQQAEVRGILIFFGLLKDADIYCSL
jgi:hypothetical protein